MHRSTWKQGERRAAGHFGSTRNALSGGNSGLTRSDSKHPKIFLESKHGKSHAVWTLYDSTKPKAKKESKTPVLAIHRKGSPGIIFCIHSSDMNEVFKQWYLAHPELSPWVLSTMNPTSPTHRSKNKPLSLFSPESTKAKPKKRRKKKQIP